jgi:hypothetical protein
MRVAGERGEGRSSFFDLAVSLTSAAGSFAFSVAKITCVSHQPVERVYSLTQKVRTLVDMTDDSQIGHSFVPVISSGRACDVLLQVRAVESAASFVSLLARSDAALTKRPGGC